MDYYSRCLLPGIDQATQLISWILAYARKCVRNRKIGMKIDLKNKILLQGVFFFNLMEWPEFAISIRFLISYVC